MILPILYSFRRCPYAMRARMALKYANINFRHREILLKDKPKSMLNYSPKGTVPVLIDKDSVIDESLEIMQWALKQNDQNDWLESTEQFELIELCDKKFKPQLDNYKYSERHELSESEYRKHCLWFLSLLETKLTQFSFLTSDKVSLADVAIFPFIRQFAFVDKDWFDNNGFEKVQMWLDKWLKSVLFTSIMQKHPLWSDE